MFKIKKNLKLINIFLFYLFILYLLFNKNYSKALEISRTDKVKIDQEKLNSEITKLFEEDLDNCILIKNIVAQTETQLVNDLSELFEIKIIGYNFLYTYILKSSKKWEILENKIKFIMQKKIITIIKEYFNDYSKLLQDFLIKLKHLKYKSVNNIITEIEINDYYEYQNDQTRKLSENVINFLYLSEEL
ncbi:hypothetical protein [Candidatus Phytoplasma pini]|uniref:Uncharacterized protein n=1 Tax=Candidatus Phytoplasma pini TaxID=267362 RepID=A0A559KJ62_9MOLU|nr:hypothetical protein [Candidatus Phytoplasma pini]TVY12171.1 hypothetical protein MDPP_00293 [Candidatus Phytoplasma pini]